jgi:hypothetical protein
MPRGIKDACLKMPAIQGGGWMPDGSKMFAIEVFIIVKSGCEAELEETGK